LKFINKTTSLNLAEVQISYYVRENFGQNNLPIVFYLHGFTGSGEDWIPIVQELNFPHSPVLVDMPGHGKTNLPGSKNSLPEFSHLLCKLANILTVEKFSLVGYSMGGRSALDFAVTFPGKISGLVIENATPGIDSESERNARLFADEQIANRMKNSTSGDFLRFWLGQGIFDSLRNNPSLELEKIIQTRAKYFNPNKTAEVFRYLSQGATTPVWDSLSRLNNIPTLLIGGEHDKKYNELLTKMSTFINGADLHIVKNAGHNVHLENPKEFINLVNPFFTKIC